MSDLQFSMTSEGLDIDLDGTLDGGITTAVNLALLAPLSWWANEYAKKEEVLAGQFDNLINSGRNLTNQTRLDAEEYARKALKWLPDIGAKSYSVSATIPDTYTLQVDIDITGPDGDPINLRYGINWQTQEVTTW